jgi:YHS domain-containing protein
MEITKVFKKNILAILHSFLIIIALSSFSIFDNYQKQTEMVIDIVCGMKVDKSEAYISEYKGKKYYFDKVECKKTFEMNPKKFIDNKCVEKK